MLSKFQVVSALILSAFQERVCIASDAIRKAGQHWNLSIGLHRVFLPHFCGKCTHNLHNFLSILHMHEKCVILTQIFYTILHIYWLGYTFFTHFAKMCKLKGTLCTINTKLCYYTTLLLFLT